MGLREQMDEAGRLRKQADAQRKERFFEQSRQRLLQILEKKFRTTFIGAISAIEESSFGRLWGHNLRHNERNENQQRWFEVWQNLRTKILNQGNAQLRAVQNELELYKVEWLRHQTNLPIKESRNS